MNLCYYSITVRKKVFDEINTLSNDLINQIDKNWSYIETKFRINGISVGENIKDLNKAVNILNDKNNINLGNELKSIWKNCILLHQIESFILPYPFLSYNFDNLYKLRFNYLKRSIAYETFLTKKMLECFLQDKAFIFLNNYVMPKWLGINFEYILTKNVFDFILLETINEMIIEVDRWIVCEYSLSTNELTQSYVEVIKIWSQLDFFLDLQYTSKTKNIS
jgi:hypothetical protein